MTDEDDARQAATRDQALTRRRLMLTAGAGAVMVLLPTGVIGSDDRDDDHRDDHDDRDDSSGRGNDNDVLPSGTAPAGSVEVRIDDDDADGFEPGTITIDAGQSVTWVNLDDDDHTATGNSFDTGVIRPGDLHTVLFHEPGSFAYSCQIHPVMVGRVEVRDASGSVPASPVATPQATPALANPDNIVVTIVNLSFDPPQLEIPVGTSVRWINEDPLPHTATATAGDFDSGTLEQDATFSHTFDAPGTYEYICAIHPNMKGSITVTG